MANKRQGKSRQRGCGRMWRDKNGVWYSDLRAIGKGRFSHKTTYRRDAEAKHDAVELAYRLAKESPEADHEPLTLDTVLYHGQKARRRTAIISKRDPDAAVETARTRCEHLERILGAAFDFHAPGVRLAKVGDEVFNALVEVLSPHTIQKVLGVLRHGLNECSRLGLFAGNPGLIMPPGLDGVYQPRDRVVTAEEFNKVIEYILPKHVDGMILSIEGGADYAELERTPKDDVNLKRDLVLVTGGTKTAKRKREIYFTDAAREVVTRLLKEPGRMLVPKWENTHRDLTRACELAGIPPFCLKDLRRTCASRLVREGETEIIVAKVLGNSAAMIRQVYGRVDQGTRRAAIQKLNRAPYVRQPNVLNIPIRTEKAVSQ